MSKSPPTRASLVLRLRDPGDDGAWNQFVEVYAPLIHAYGLHHGLQDADAADLAQEVLQSVASAAGRFDYDPRRGSFRGWLFTITRNKLRTMLTRRRNREAVSGGTEVRRLLDQQPDDDASEEFWNRQHQLRLFSWAAERIRDSFQESTWDAFWKTAVEHESAAGVADEMGMTVGAVYIAKSRVIARLREEIQTLEDE